jgi:uncharacterized membrane protein
MNEVLELAALFACYFVFIGLRAFQQINVQYEQAKMIVPTSVAMASVEVYVIAALASRGWGWVTVAVYGLAAGLGSLLAMKIQRRLRDWWNDKKKKEQGPVEAVTERT